jgi:hypothetical protein
MERDMSKFPDDDNGSILWKLATMGFDLEGDRIVRFAMLFPKAEDALRFGVFLLRQSYTVKVNEIDEKTGFLGEVLVDIFMNPTHQELTEAEEWLLENLAEMSGKNDGWQVQTMPPQLEKTDWHKVGA